MNEKLTYEKDKAELIGQIIDGFEDMLEGLLDTGELERRNFEAFITGNRYDALYKYIWETLENWNVI